MINSVHLVGNLTKDAEFRMTSTGKGMCTFRIAVNDRKKSGEEWVDVPYYFPCVLFKGAEKRQAYLTKGRKVSIQGVLTWRSWEKDGKLNSVTEIRVDEIEWLDNGSQQKPQQKPVEVIADDDIPF